MNISELDGVPELSPTAESDIRLLLARGTYRSLTIQKDFFTHSESPFLERSELVSECTVALLARVIDSDDLIGGGEYHNPPSQTLTEAEKVDAVTQLITTPVSGLLTDTVYVADNEDRTNPLRVLFDIEAFDVAISRVEKIKGVQKDPKDKEEFFRLREVLPYQWAEAREGGEWETILAAEEQLLFEFIQETAEKMIGTKPSEKLVQNAIMAIGVAECKTFSQIHDLFTSLLGENATWADFFEVLVPKKDRE